MDEDPIVAEVRRIRDEYARSFNYDLAAICQDLRERQALGQRRVLRRDPKRPSQQRLGERRTLGKTEAGGNS